MCCSLGWGQFVFFSTPSMRFKACDVEVVVMITSLSKSWSTDLRTLYAYLQGSLDQFLAWHYHRLFFSPEAFYLSQLIFFVMGWVSKATVAEAYCHVIHHAKQLVLQVQGAVHTDCLWDSRWLQQGLPSGCFMEAWTVPNASVFFKLVSTCHKIPQTSLLIMYKNFTRTSHPGKWGSLKNLMLMMVFRRMVFFLMVFLLWMALLLWMMEPHHLHHHHHHRLQGPCHRIILLHKVMQSCHWDKIFFIV